MSRLSGSLVLLAPLTMVACGGGETPGAAAGGGRGAFPPAEVQTVTLAPKPIPQSSEFVATIRSLRSTTIQPQVEGLVTQIFVKAGDRVRAGQPLLQIDPDKQQAAVTSMESQRASREADLAYATQQVTRLRKLLEAGAVSQADLDQAESAYKNAEAQLAALRSQIRETQVQLQYYRVTAPATGIVGDITIRQGDRVTPSTIITTVDEPGVIRYQSPGTIHMLGLPPESFVGQSLFALVDREQATRGRALLTGAFDGSDKMPVGEFSLQHVDGTLRHIEVVASRIAPEAGVQRVVLNSRDVTERKRAEDAVRARDEMLVQAQKMEAVGRLAGGIAHDFSNVLTVVTQACERLRDRIEAGVASTTEIDMILRNTERAASLTRRLQAFSRQQVLAPRPLHLGKLVHTASELLEQFIGEDIHLSIEIAPDLHPVEADPVQIQQVLMNLAINARDAMPAGGWLRFRAWNRAVDQVFADAHPPMVPGEYVLLEVSDTGHGMDAGTKARVFEPFFTTKDPVRAGGLGLSTVYGIVKQSGGFIWIDSIQGHGTSISLYLPPTDAQPVEVEVKKPAKKRASKKHATILLTEDEDDVRELLDDMLTTHGFKVLVAANAGEAMTRAGQHHGTIDLLLTDVVMPGGTGRDLARQLTAARPEMRVLYMSGYPEHGAPPGSVLEPGVPFLSKPFTRDLLLEKIRDLLA